jgi:hypothetical protein
VTNHERISNDIRLGFAKRRQAERDKEEAARHQAEYNAYRAEVRRLTELQPLDQVSGIEQRGASHHLDHVVSIRAAWLAGWPVEQCAHVDNLQVLPWQENFRKGNDCYCTLNLSSRITPN